MNALLHIVLLAVATETSAPDPGLFKHTEPVRERDPARAVVFQGRGNELVAAGKYEAAIEQFRRAAAYDPLNADPLVNMAFCLDKLSRYLGANGHAPTLSIPRLPLR